MPMIMLIIFVFGLSSSQWYCLLCIWQAILPKYIAGAGILVDGDLFVNLQL